jgi:hypothetical protein
MQRITDVLKGNRNKAMQEVMNKLQYGLNNLSLTDGSFYVPTNGHQYHAGYNGEIASPHHAQGWPPELQEYIKRVAIATAMAIVDSIYTEEELNERVDRILLTDEDGQNKPQ